MRKRNKAIARTLLLIVVIAVVAVAAVSFYIISSPQPSTTTSVSTIQTTPSITSSTSSTTISTSSIPSTTSTSSSTTSVTPPSTTSSPTTTTTPQGFQLFNMTNVNDALSFATHIKFKFEVFNKTESERIVSNFTLDDRGDDIVNGKKARKIDFIIEEDGDVSTLTFWYSKEDWSTIVKAVVDGEEVPESYLSYVGYYTQAIFYPFMFLYAGSLSPLLSGPVPAEFGTMQLVSVRDITYGKTTLNVHEYRFTPNPLYKPLEKFSGITFMLAPISGYTYLTGYKTDFKDGSYYSYELIELTRP